MARVFMLLGALLLVLAPCIGLPQGMAPAQPPGMVPPQPVPAPGWQNAGTWQFPVSPGFGSFGNRPRYEDENWVVTAGVRFGQQWMRFNTFFPFASNSDPEQQVFAFERMDLQLKDGNFWVGYANLEAQPLPTVVVFGRYGANIPRNSQMYMDATGRFTRPGTAIIDPGPPPVIGALGNGANSISPWTWDTEFHWWMWEAGLDWWLLPEVALEAGFRYEHIDYRLQHPRDPAEAVAQGPPGQAIICDRI